MNGQGGVHMAEGSSKRKAAAETAASVTESLCVVCRFNIGTLPLDDGFICEDCAQYLSEAGHELSLE